MVTCRLSQYFDDPLSYRPERWIGESKKLLHPFSLLPFGYGSRMCVGRRVRKKNSKKIYVLLHVNLI